MQAITVVDVLLLL